MNKKSFVFLLLGLLLLAAAAALTCYNVSESRHVGERSETITARLKMRLPSEQTESAAADRSHDSDTPVASAQKPDYLTNPEMDMPAQEIDGERYIGLLRLPTLELELPVLETWSYERLKLAPCHYTGSAYLHNMVIAAHNYTVHFGKLELLSLGDPIIFEDMDGNSFRYEVASIEILAPTAISEMTDSEWALTLFTCTLSGANRITVRCTEAEQNTAA